MPTTNGDDLDESAPLREEIKLKKRRLQARRLQAARSGSMTDPEITLEIEDLEQEIPKLERKLAQLASAAPAPTTAEAPSKPAEQRHSGASGPNAQPVAPLPQSIPLVLRIADQGDRATIAWEADVIGRRQSTFRLL